MNDSGPIVLAPFANERMREWPIANFQRLIDRGLDDGRHFELVGTLAQRPLADAMVRPYRSDRVSNLCGTIGWLDVQDRIRSAAFVVANNSGIAHVAARLGQWVLCVFGAKHSWIEWMPRGPRVVTLVRAPACSPCHAGSCPNSLCCLDMLDPDFAYDEISRAIREAHDLTSRASVS